ncbi:MAG: Uncharacterized protein XD76_0432 [candidate division TA06 bacterium 32_111]|uniref:Uncharacterized protein n=3 Tax=Bacteria candidate phyla TaxID=1783234 RepID=A0A348MLB7_UNCW3|nr:MAG: Uncharacterized protein XD76_0432 [candidate division TA06 bacterium 32_111]HAF07843.1 hypothetical protein [candidate division WOR-3 bacterium]HCP17361.1 hypothetical protein [candidate division WOR-3 bacterium]
MNNRIKELYGYVTLTFKNLLINYQKERWNFLTNSTIENRKRLLNSVEEIQNFMDTDKDYKEIFYLLKKYQKNFSQQQKDTLLKIKKICDILQKTPQQEKHFDIFLSTAMDIINDRINFNNKDTTTSHLADLAEHETSLQEIISIQKHFFQPTQKFKDRIEKVVLEREEYIKSKNFKSYFEFFTKINGLKEKDIFKDIEKLDDLTREDFKKLKNQLEQELAKKLKLHAKSYPSYIFGDPFFRTYPVHLDNNVNTMFKGKDIAYTGKKFFDILGYDLSDVYEVSDLYIRPGKYPFIIDIDGNDIRFSVNTKSNFRGTYWLLRTLSKVVYILEKSKNKTFFERENIDRRKMETFGIIVTNFAFKSGLISRILSQYEDEEDQLSVDISDYLEKNNLILSRFFLSLSNFEIEINGSEKVSNFSDIWVKNVQKYQLIEIKDIFNKDGWALLDSIIMDPFSSIFEVEGFLLSKKLEKKIDFKNLKQKTFLKTIFEIVEKI